jgi:hypothetical protein
MATIREKKNEAINLKIFCENEFAPLAYYAGMSRWRSSRSGANG